VTILLVVPPSSGPNSGNRVTAERWAGLLGQLGHETAIDEGYRGQACEVLVALHAEKSAPSVLAFQRAGGARPFVVALTGTDLHTGLASAAARQAIELAWRLVVLQPLAVLDLPPQLQGKTRVILQSCERVEGAPAVEERFEVAVAGHLRPVKDPFRAAEAVRLLPRGSRIHVVHVGAALTPEMAARARGEQAANPRYEWLGDLPRHESLRVLARARLLVLSSLAEGGANVLSEAIVHGVPVLASHIRGSIGLLGADYPGYFPAGDTAALAALLGRCEAEPRFEATLREHVRALAPRFAPEHEREAWRGLLDELG
jgi:putative glycosyltransferase (TIGR04348 family)